MGAPRVMKAPVRVDNLNLFLTMAWQVANHIHPNSSCYVCGLIPYTTEEGLPLMALPASDCDTCHLMHISLPQSYTNPECHRVSKMRPLNCSQGTTNCYRCQKRPKPVPIVLIPRPFSWCLENDGKTPECTGFVETLHTHIFQWITKDVVA
ncbi:hypothetical protein PAMP_024315 [Pampus punctatissimus]